MTPSAATLRARLHAGELLDGLVVRTPSHHVLEVLAAAPIGSRPDVVMLDGEHAPIDGTVLDVMLAVTSAHNLPCLVRVAERSQAAVQRALDGGATGIVVPHVESPEAATLAVRIAHYGDGGRGYSGSTRAAGWGQRPMRTVVEAAAASTTVVIQVEDAEALDAVDDIVAVHGVDAVLIGAADLAVSLGVMSTSAVEVIDACERIAKACSAAGTPIAALATSPEEVARWRTLGATLLLHGTDQSRLLTPVSEPSARTGSPR